MFLYLCGFIGGIALFLYGMQIMSDGFQKAAGDKMQKVLQALTGVAVFGVALGAIVTAVLQSSSATTVMTLGLVNAGLLNLQQAFGIVMGANIGTTITAQLIAFKLTDYVALLLGIGFIMQAVGKRKNLKYGGQILLGIGILMLGMDMMGDAVAPLKEFPEFVEFIRSFADKPLLALTVGLVMTLLVQSSAATIGILIAMATQGLITLEGAIPVVLGDNIGTCITAVLATIGANISTKRVALSHVLFNSIGSILFIIFLPMFIKWVMMISPADDVARQIANAHMSFNILNTLLFLPFVKPFTSLVAKLLPGEMDIVSMKPQYLNDEMLGTPALALSLASKEVVRMAEQAQKNMSQACDSIFDRDSKKIDYVLRHEPVIDKLEEEVTAYLTKISEKRLSPELSMQHTGLLHACSDIERIGDHSETIVKRIRKMEEDPISFSPAAMEELRKLADLVLTTSQLAMDALANNDKELAQQSLTTSKLVKQTQKDIRKNHVTRLNEGSCTPANGFVMLELLINMKRVSDHSRNISQIVLGEF